MNNTLVYFYLVFGVVLVVLVDDQMNGVDFKKGKYIRLAIELFSLAYFIDPLKNMFSAHGGTVPVQPAVASFATGLSPF